jgi:hypothetical protein
LTYEDLIVAIDEAAPKLAPTSLRLLLRLVSLAIQTGSGTIHMSHRKLAELLDLSREGVARATRGLEHLIEIDRNNTTVSKFVLPVQWFPPQPTLFPVQAGLKSRPIGLDSRPALANSPGQLANFPGQSTGLNSRPIGLDSRPALANFPGQLANFPGQTGLEIRPVGTENQQDSADSLIRSDQNPDLDSRSSINQISQISTIRRLQHEQKEVASLLSLALVRYMQLHHPPGGGEAKPPEIVLARCLYIASYDTLTETLGNLHNEGRCCGQKFAWFVAVFLQRIHGVDPTVLADTLERERAAKKVKPADEPLFAETLVADVAAGVRRMA